MSDAGMTPQENPQARSFQKNWIPRVIALVLGLALIIALLPTGLRRLWTPAETPDPEPEPTQEPVATPATAPAVSTPAPTERSTELPPGSVDVTEATEAFLNAYTQLEEALTEGDYETALRCAEDCLALAETQEQTAVALAQQGNVLFLLERYAEAEEAYQTLLEMDAEEQISMRSLYSMLARCQLLCEKLDEALNSCNRAFDLAEEETESAELYALRGVIQFYRGEYETAKADFQTAMEAGYEDTELLQTQIDQCEELLAQSQGIPAQIGTAVYTAPQPSAEETNAATQYFAGNYRQAEEAFRSLLGRSYYYSDMQLYSNIAKCQYLQGNFSDAAESCTAGLALRGDEERAALHTLRASSYMALGESALAAEDFLAAVEYGTADPELNTLQAAICCYFSGDFARCVELGAPLIETEGYGEAVLWVGLSHYMLGDFAAAAEDLSASVDLDQSYCREDELFRLLTRCRFQLGAWEAAIASATDGLERSEAIEPQDLEIAAELLQLRGSAYLSLGQFDAALEDLADAADLGGETYEILSQMTLCAFVLGLYSEAVELGARAMELGEPTADLYYWVGLAEFSTERYAEARETLQLCRDLEPDKENIHFYIGVCSFSMEEYAQAATEFTTSVEAGEPAAERSRYNRAICYLQTEQYESAKADLEAIAASEDSELAQDAADLLESLKTVLG